MVVGTASRGCQVAVIGGGPGGYLAAIRLAQLNKDVILIEERDELGGICLNEGCIPSKALIHVADLMEDVQGAKSMGLTFESLALDFSQVMKWKNRIVKKLTGGVTFLARKNGVEVLQGRARFDSDRRLEVFTPSGPVFVEFEQAVVCTGSDPAPLAGFEVDGEWIMGPREALALKAVPASLVVIGGGYIGLEMGSVYRRFGSEVHIVEQATEILGFHDPEVRQVMEKRLKDIGVHLHTGSRVERVDDSSRQAVQIVGPEDTAVTVSAERILVAVGRQPNTGDLNVAAAGIALDERGFISVNNRMETNVPGIFAVGDVVGGPLLAHKAYREAKVAAEVIAGNAAAFDNVVIPAVVFTDPELAWAGMTEKEAREAGYQVVTGTFPFRASGRAMTLNATDGFVKTIADAETKQILGVTIVGRDAAEMISEAALAMEMGAFLDDLSQTIHPHPTLSEGLLESVEAALGEAVHVLNVDGRRE